MQFTWNQAKAVGKHAASYLAGAVSFAVVTGVLSAPDGAGITENMNTIGDGLAQVGKGLAGLAAILTPIYTAWRAAHNASPTAQTAAVVATLEAAKTSPVAATVLEQADRNKLISAVGDMPEVKRILADPEVAQATPSAKVVAS